MTYKKEKALCTTRKTRVEKNKVSWSAPDKCPLVLLNAVFIMAEWTIEYCSCDREQHCNIRASIRDWRLVLLCVWDTIKIGKMHVHNTCRWYEQKVMLIGLRLVYNYYDTRACVVLTALRPKVHIKWFGCASKNKRIFYSCVATLSKTLQSQCRSLCHII